MEKICNNCRQQFEIAPEDLAFYEKVSPVFNGKKYPIPPPTLCQHCRQQRRMAFRNERNLYHRKCDLCQQQIISMYHANSPYKVYCNNCWWSDKWSALDKGQEFNFNEPFFKQIKKLQRQVPRLALMQKNSVNSDYTNHCENNQNCYLCIDTIFSQDAYYSKWIINCQNCTDCYNIEDAQLCYETQYQMKGYRNIYNFFSDFSTESSFIYNCVSCSNCFMCSNLYRKQYCVYNKQLTKEEYENFISGINLGSYEELQKFKQEYYEMIIKTPKRAGLLIMCEDSEGDCLYKCKNVKNSFDNVESQDCRYCYESGFLKDCYDVYETAFECELLYECHGSNRGKFLRFSNVSYDMSDSEYVDICHNSSYLFGCIGLRNKKYCILNKQYSKEEYEIFIPKIIEFMKKSGEWGEFFPISLSPFAYNETIVQEYFPLDKVSALKSGANWKDDNLENRYEGTKIEIPDNIKDISDDITKKILTCHACQKNYRVIMQELNFYRTMNLPIPRICTNCRYKERLSIRNRRKLWERNCDLCGIAIKTPYNPTEQQTVYCEECYLKEVY